MKAPIERTGPATAAELALMQGAPPPPDRHVTLANWQEGPYNRWGFQHVGEIVPSAVISRGTGPVAELPARLEELGALPLDGVACASTLDQLLRESYTDGFLVLHEGSVRYERYFNGMGPRSLHLLHSISKSLCGALTGEFVELGIIDVAAPVRAYVPELWDSAFGDATIAQLLDMTAAVAFREDYADPTRRFRRRTAPQVGGRGAHTILRTRTLSCDRCVRTAPTGPRSSTAPPQPMRSPGCSSGLPADATPICSRQISRRESARRTMLR
jgi:CubicO group peptidase (beta-lactamase class C family)